MIKRILFILIMCCGLNGAVIGAVLSGVVQDENKEAIPGATIMIKGTGDGTITDVEGRFTITVNESDVLQISSLGFKTQEIIYKGQATLSVTLTSDVMNLEEFVSVGYGSRKKVNLTGAVENISTEDIATRTITNAGQALQGKVSGVIITQNSGQPGQDEAEIRIRGVSSIENSNDPLVIIDGIEGQLDDVNPKNIESMSVLKDASSAAIYGNRAAAGVIIITTKSGTKGLKVNASITNSLQQVTTFPKVANAYEYATLLNEARLNSGFPNVPYDDDKLEEIKNGTNPSLQNVDLYDFYFSPAMMQNYYASVSGGQDNYNFAFSTGYLNQDGVLYGTGADKLTYSAKLNAKFWDKKLRTSFSVKGYNKNEEELSSSTASVMSYNANSSPIGFLQAVDTATNEPGLYGGKAKYYAIDEAGGGTDITRNNFSYQLSAELEPVKGLKAKVLYGKTLYDYEKQRLLASVTLAGNPNEDVSTTVTDSQYDLTQTESSTSTFTGTLNYNKSLGVHKFGVLLGYEYLDFKTNSDFFSVKFLLANQPYFPFGDPETFSTDGYISERSTMSYFGRVDYAYKDKYLFEANVRRDGSSRFSEGNRWGTFPSFSLGWRVSEESFMDDMPVSLKLRASWGRLGNERMKEYYPTYDEMVAGEYYNFDNMVVQGTGTSLLGNDDLVWEISEQTNIGLDMTLFDAFTFSANYFQKLTSGILGRVDVPLSLGLGNSTSSKPYQNVGEMINKGIESTFQYNKRWKNWSFNSTFNLTYITNEVLDLGDLSYVAHNDVVSGYLPPSDIIRSQVGRPFGSYYGLTADGIYQVDDFTWQGDSDPTINHYDRLYKLKDGSVDPSAIIANPQPGDIKFKDINGPDGEKDGKITEDDIDFMGSSQPDLIYSINLYTEYKNWSLNVLGQGVYGANAYIMGALTTPFWGGRGNISKEIVNNHWSYDNPSEEYQRVYDDSQRANIVSSYYLQDASYFRIKNIELAYAFDDLVSVYGIDEMKVSLSVENALLFSKMDGFDPEKSFNKITPDFHPQVRIYSLGVNLKF